MIKNLRVGSGFDVHAFEKNRDLILCGVKIPYEFGLKGHSDADVAIHALMDALLGAAGFRDIGYFFPDNDDKYKGIDSTKLLKIVLMKLKENNWEIINVDVTILAQKPKLSPYIDKMKERLIELLKISNVSIKATTTEKLGFVGREEGIATFATVLIYKNE